MHSDPFVCDGKPDSPSTRAGDRCQYSINVMALSEPTGGGRFPGVTSLLVPSPPSPTMEGRAAATFELVRAWMFSDAMSRLLEAFGEVLPASGMAWTPGDSAFDWLHLNEDFPSWVDALVGGTGDRRLADDQLDVVRRALAIERLAADDFNFRSRDGVEYKERSQAVEADFSDDLRRLVHTQADDLGLVTPVEARYRTYDRTLVLGGGYRSPLLRARYAKVLQSQGIDLGALYFLGSPRFLIADPPERPKVESYAPAATDEFDLMAAAGCAEFGLSAAAVELVCGCASVEMSCPRWKERDDPQAGDTPAAYTHERKQVLTDAAGEPAAVVLSASTGRPPYRPDTSDTFALWGRIAQPRHGERILIVTTQVFVPFQTFDGVRQLQLRSGVDIDVVGFGAEWGDRVLTAEYLLQEVLSAIRSARRLLVDAAAILTGPPAP